MFVFAAIGLVVYDKRLGVLELADEDRETNDGYRVMMNAKM